VNLDSTQAGGFSEYLADPYAKRQPPREPIHSESDVLIVGGGFSGLLAAVRLKQAGLNVRIIERGGDFGGTW
jgi:cyclohexanone monooxygenase